MHCAKRFSIRLREFVFHPPFRQAGLAHALQKIIDGEVQGDDHDGENGHAAQDAGPAFSPVSHWENRHQLTTNPGCWAKALLIIWLARFLADWRKAMVVRVPAA